MRWVLVVAVLAIGCIADPGAVTDVDSETPADAAPDGPASVPVADAVVTTADAAFREPAPCEPSCPAIDWIGIEGGVFQMGSNDGEAHETPVHPVDVPAFVEAEGWREPTTCDWRDQNYGVAGQGEASQWDFGQSEPPVR